jgi:hypothetical protein
MIMKKAILSIGMPALSIGVYQGWKVRTEYLSRRLDVNEPFPGPHCGFEQCKVSAELRGDGIFEKGISRIKHLMQRNDKISETSNNRRKIKLVILGDSLAFGIGCDEPKAGPILPKYLARTISTALNADVDWISDGKIGGTVSEIRSKILPGIKNRLLESSCGNCDAIASTQSATELIVIVICGLNDWKEMLEKFPFGLGHNNISKKILLILIHFHIQCGAIGPVSFKEDLSRLVNDIKVVAQQTQMPCKIFLPSMPLACTLSDPQCSFRIAPLHFLVRGICWIWDLQKHTLAFDDPKVSFKLTLASTWH